MVRYAALKQGTLGLLFAVAAKFVRYNCPLGKPCASAFVTAPAQIGTVILEYCCIGLILAHKLKKRFKFINLLFAAGTLAAGTVKPDVKNLAVVGKQLS